MTLDLQKMSKNDSFHKIFFLAENYLKEVKLSPQHQLKGFGLISEPYFSKRGLAIFPKNP